jgi:ATP-dependent RNA helicase DHX36
VDVDLVKNLVAEIVADPAPDGEDSDGAILVFLTGWDEITKLNDLMRADRILGDPRQCVVLPLHGAMPTANQREIFDKPPPGVRKIILSTNIAETSITIDDITHVVDCGKAKEKTYDALNNLACLKPAWISKASAHQRRYAYFYFRQLED